MDHTERNAPVPAPPGAPASRRRADTTDRVARGWVEAWSHGDLAGIRALLAEDASVECNLGWPAERAALLDTMSRLAAEIDSVSLLSLTAAADRAAILYDCRTKAPAGTIRLAEFIEMEGSQVTGVRRVYDVTAIDALLPDLRRPLTPR